MWGLDLNKDNTMGLGTFWGHVDLFTYSYAAAGEPKQIDANLAAKIAEHDDDIRFFWFNIDGSTLPIPNYYYTPLNKFFDAGRIPQGDRQWENDEVFMRVEEMYLIAAEGYARAGGPDHLDAAKEILAALLEQRDAATAAMVSDMSQDELLETIYYNWRVEMWGEGKGLLTMKRFQKTVTLGTNNLYHKNEQLSWDDERLTFTIPQREIANNPLLAN